MRIDNSLISILCLGGMLIGVLFTIIYSKGDKRRNKASAVFVFSAAILLGNWLLKDKGLLYTLEENIVYALLGIVITFLKIWIGR